MISLATCFIYHQQIDDHFDSKIIHSHAYFTSSEPFVYLVAPSNLSLDHHLSIFAKYREIDTVLIVRLDILFGSRSSYNRSFYNCKLSGYLSKMSYSHYLVIQSDVLLHKKLAHFYSFLDNYECFSIIGAPVYHRGHFFAFNGGLSYRNISCEVKSYQHFNKTFFTPFIAPVLTQNLLSAFPQFLFIHPIYRKLFPILAPIFGYYASSLISRIITLSMFNNFFFFRFCVNEDVFYSSLCIRSLIATRESSSYYLASSFFAFEKFPDESVEFPSYDFLTNIFGSHALRKYYPQAFSKFVSKLSKKFNV